MSSRLLLALLLFLFPFSTHLASQELITTLYGQYEENEIGGKIKCTEDGSRFAFSSSLYLPDNVYHQLVTVYDFVNGEWEQIGTPIDCAINFSETLDSYVNFDLSSDGQKLIIRSNGNYFHYELQNDEWYLKHTIEFDLDEHDWNHNFSLSGDGNTLCIIYITLSFHEILTYNYLKEDWQLVNTVTIPGSTQTKIDISFDGKSLAYSKGSGSSSHPLYHQLIIFNWLDKEWVQKGNSIDLHGSHIEFRGDLLNFEFDKNANSLLIGGIGADTTFFRNSTIVRVFEYKDKSWFQKGQDLLGNHDEDGFGFEVNFSNDGNRLITNAPFSLFDSVRGNGILKIYDFVDPVWVLKKDSIVGSSEFELCGYSHDLNGDGTILFSSCPFSHNPTYQEGKIEIYSLDPYTAVSQTLTKNLFANFTPNPASDRLYLDCKNICEFQIFNNAGIQVMKGSYRQEINISHLVSGLYHLRVLKDGLVYSNKFVKI